MGVEQYVGKMYSPIYYNSPIIICEHDTMILRIWLWVSSTLKFVCSSLPFHKKSTTLASFIQQGPIIRAIIISKNMLFGIERLRFLILCVNIVQNCCCCLVLFYYRYTRIYKSSYIQTVLNSCSTAYFFDSSYKLYSVPCTDWTVI